MLRAHRQAWAWQDEWVGLNMEDIRKLEDETKDYLSNVIKSKSVNESFVDFKKDDKSENIIFEETSEETQEEDLEEVEENESSDVFFDCFEANLNVFPQRNNNHKSKHAQMLRWSSELLLISPEKEKKNEPLIEISSLFNNNKNRTLVLLVFQGDIFPTVSD